jgi:hypothetical protein
MLPKRRKQTNVQLQKGKGYKPVLYSRRCNHCVQGHRICSRTKPCKICVGAGRADLCDFPDENSRVPRKDTRKKKQASNENMKVRARSLSYCLPYRSCSAAHRPLFLVLPTKCGRSVAFTPTSLLGVTKSIKSSCS